MRKKFSQYALSLMLHQMLVSYKYIAYEDEDDDVQIEEKEPIDENEFGEGIHRPPDEKP